MTALSPEHATMPVFGRLSPYATRDEQIAHIAEAARQIRIQDLLLVHHAGAGHIGGDFSAVDVLATLYGAVLNVTPEAVDDPERDRFILSKGHVAGALYTTLVAFGFLEVAELATFLEGAEQHHDEEAGAKQVKALRKHVRRTLEPAVETILAQGAPDLVVGTSKTLRSLARVAGAAPSSDGQYAARELRAADVTALVDRLVRLALARDTGLR